MAVSADIRYEVRERAKHKSELSGRGGRPLQCCHLSHNRDQYYNGLDVVVLVTDIEHLAYHMLFTNKPLEIGLHKGHNNWAIDTLLRDIHRFNDKVNRVMTDEQIEKEVEQAKNFWFYYLGIEES